uniref:Fucolectin tachylectin-4 pentraxin-1 domain-containing protein n=1 Tax=Scleropages formosus TaxID=113540 RepID=A0A8C9VI42_SCLFO
MRSLTIKTLHIQIKTWCKFTQNTYTHEKRNETNRCISTAAVPDAILIVKLSYLCIFEDFGTATQSSQFDSNGAAGKAIDGKRNTKYADGSCTHTKQDSKPWWRMDLHNVYTVTSVTITNRGDCCPERIDGAEIRVGNSLDDNGNQNPLYAMLQILLAWCNGMTGRYVSVVLPRSDFLTLCEVEVNGYIKNLALKGTATQSSQYNAAGAAGKAIDGKRNAKFSDHSCTHTERDSKPWWKVDLHNVYTVTSVTITNRGDCCAQRINGAEIRIGNSLDDNGNQNPLCAVITSIPAGNSRTFQCNGMTGRYVNVVLPRPDFLTLCEVEVNGYLSTGWYHWQRYCCHSNYYIGHTTVRKMFVLLGDTTFEVKIS